jgi:hypothetical protein
VVVTVHTSQLLILLALLAFGLYTSRLRSTLLDRLIYLVLAGLGVVLALNPDGATAVSQSIGIGRGVDLLFYLFIVFSLFHYAGSAGRMRKMERDTTAIARALAIATAEHVGTSRTAALSASSTQD